MIDVDTIIAYEAGELDEDSMVALFQKLVDTGQAWRLQGHYGRTARALIDSGHVIVRTHIADDGSLYQNGRKVS